MKSSNRKSMIFHYVIHYIGLPLILWTFSRSLISTVYAIQNRRMTLYLLIDIAFILLILLLAAISFVGFFWQGYQSWRAILLLFPAITSYRVVILIFAILNHSNYYGTTVVTTQITLFLSIVVLLYYRVRKCLFVHRSSRARLKLQRKANLSHQGCVSYPQAEAIHLNSHMQLKEHDVIPCFQDLKSIGEGNQTTSRFSPFSNTLCPYCGRHLPPNGGEYCRNCGTKLPSQM